MPDKIVYLKRSRPFIHDASGTEAFEDAQSNTKKGVGSYFASKNSKKIGTGLTTEEENLLMPLLLDVPANHLDFPKRVQEFFIDIYTDVPYGKGRSLNIGLKYKGTLGKIKLEDGTEVINIPIDVSDYIRYRHALKHPLVSPSVEANKGDTLSWFYFEDPQLVAAEKIRDAELADNAILSYNRIKDDLDTVECALTILQPYIKKRKNQPFVVVERLSAEERKLELRQLAVDRPSKFLDTVNNKNLKALYIVNQMLTFNVLRRIGNSILDSETGNDLGTSVEEVVVNLDNAQNSALKNRLVQQYKQRKSEGITASLFN